MEPSAFAEFWGQLPPDKKIHPADKPILDAEEHIFEFANLPAFGAGPLATAPVVLCYLNNRPIYKLNERDRGFITKQEEELKDTWGRYLAGVVEGDSRSEPRPHTEWGRKRIARLNPALQEQVAIFNIVPYRSESFRGKKQDIAHHLPSSRMAHNHLHDVLLPAAARGERFIVIVWGPKLWRVRRTQIHGTLAVLNPGPGGYLGKNVEDRINTWWASRQ